MQRPINTVWYDPSGDAWWGPWERQYAEIVKLGYAIDARGPHYTLVQGQQAWRFECWFEAIEFAENREWRKSMFGSYDQIEDPTKRWAD